jgi:proteic killer suppression protein
VIIAFADAATARFYRDGVAPPRWREVERIVARKLDMLDAAISLKDLRSPPGNRLEALKGDRRGQYSIRVNDRWRVCFEWTEAGPSAVEVVDYHD